MADLQVQPKKSGSIIPWILLLLGIAALIYFLSNGWKKGGEKIENAADTVAAKTESMVDGAGDKMNTAWNDVDFNAPTLSYDEITDRNVSVRGTDRYGIYVLGENILFDQGKATIKSGAEGNLKMIASSLDKRYANGDVRIYGHTDNTGDAAANKQLAEERAENVRQWLIKNANMTDARVTVHPVGESQPIDNNNTAAGREQNRRVEIVAMNK